MKEITILILSLLLISVALPSIIVLRSKVSYLQREAVNSGAASWVPDNDDPKILVLKFKER